MARDDAMSRVVVDTNVLLAATDTSRHTHAAALSFLDGDARALAVTPQIVREYLAVATRPVEANGLGLDGAAAAMNVVEILRDIDILSEGAATADRLTALVAAERVAGKQVHDGNVVAVALEHGASTIVTDDRRHFSRFSHLLTIEQLET